MLFQDIPPESLKFVIIFFPSDPNRGIPEVVFRLPPVKIDEFSKSSIIPSSGLNFGSTSEILNIGLSLIILLPLTPSYFRSGVPESSLTKL